MPDFIYNHPFTIIKNGIKISTNNIYTNTQSKSIDNNFIYGAFYMPISVWIKLNGFNENLLSFGYIDMDFMFRAHKAGYHITKMRKTLNNGTCIDTYENKKQNN